MYGWVLMWLCTCVQMFLEARGIRSFIAGVTDHRWLPDVGAEKRMWILYKGSVCSESLSHHYSCHLDSLKLMPPKSSPQRLIAPTFLTNTLQVLFGKTNK